MKRRRHTAEERIRIPRKVGTGKSIVDICRERNVWDVHRQH